MRSGKTLQQLAAQIRTEQGQKKDFVANTTKLEYQAEGGQRGRIHFQVAGNDYDVEPTQLCLRQIGERVGIPANYMERLAIVQPENSIDHRPLLATNINYWFRNQPENRMIRTLMNGSQVGRAFLSERYRPLDNADLAEAVLPRLVDAGCEVISSEITEKRLYIQAATPRVELDIAKIMKERGIVGLHSARPLETDTPAGIAALAGVEVSELPVWLQHWYRSAPYYGNNILSDVDPMECELTNPWMNERHRTGFYPEISIAFCKTTLSEWRRRGFAYSAPFQEEPKVAEWVRKLQPRANVKFKATGRRFRVTDAKRDPLHLRDLITWKARWVSYADLTQKYEPDPL